MRICDVDLRHQVYYCPVFNIVDMLYCLNKRPQQEVSSRWYDVQALAQECLVDAVDMKQRRQELDASGAEMRAEMAEADADFAIAFATSAITVCIHTKVRP